MRARAPIEVDPTDREANWAVAVAGGLYFVGALLCATGALLPELRAPFAIGAVGVLALSTSGLLLLVWHQGRGTLMIAYLADLWGIVLIAALCAGSGGHDSPFALIYVFAIGHAAAFQPRGRLYIVALASLVAFLSPLVYETGTSTDVRRRGDRGHRDGPDDQRGGPLRAQQDPRAAPSPAGADHRERRLDRSLDPAETLRSISRDGRAAARAGVRRRRLRRERLDRLDGRRRRRPRAGTEIEASQPDPPRGDLHLDGVASLLDEPAVGQEAGAPLAGSDPPRPARTRRGRGHPDRSTGTSTRR